MDINEKRRNRKQLAEQARALVDKADQEKREMTAEESEQWDRIMVDVDKLKAEIDREERMRDVESTLGRRDHEPNRPDPAGAGVPSQDEYREAFRSYLRFGVNAMPVEQRQVLQSRFQQLTPEQRALASGVDASGGFTVPEGFFPQIIEAFKQFGGMRQSRATVISTDSGNDLPIPTNNDTANEGAIVSENTQLTEQDVAFAQKILKAYMYTSKIIRVSYQLLQDSAFDLETWLARKLGERIGRVTNRHFATGTGTNEPQGIVTGATLGKTGAAGQVNSIIFEDLVDLEHSVDPAYRMQAEWMLHDDMLKTIKKLKDSDGRPLWLPGLAMREPDTIMSHPFVVNQNVPQPAASAKSLLFGDLSNYFIRDVRGVQVLRLQERYADFLQVGFLAFSRHDGGLVDGGMNPIKYYQHPAA